jgi:hypothetical protein
MSENSLSGQSSQGSNAALWLQQTPLKTSWHLLRMSGLHAWERLLATNPALTEKELHSIQLLAILYDRNPVPCEYQTVEAISACLEVLISGAGKTEELIIPTPAQVSEWLKLLGLSVAEQPIVSGFGPEGITGFNKAAARRYGLPPEPVPPWLESKIGLFRSGPEPLEMASPPTIVWVTPIEEKVSESCIEYTFQLSTGEIHRCRKWHSPSTPRQKRETQEAEQFLCSVRDPSARPPSAKERAHQRQRTRQLGRKLRGEVERRDAERRKDSQ